MRNHTADAKHDWGLLMTLIAVEVGKQQPLMELTGDSANVQFPLVLARCKAIAHVKLKQPVESLYTHARTDLAGFRHACMAVQVCQHYSTILLVTWCWSASTAVVGLAE